MYSVTFEYARHRLRAIPLIPVGLRAQQRWIEVWAYADSGAFYSLFDDKVAEVLGIQLEQGKRLLAVVGDGSFIPFYLHKVKMRLGEDEFEIEVGFSDKLGVGFNLLGMNLFDRYKVTVDNQAKRVTFERE
ncbi:MAG: hypothetical protein NZO41_03160 [Candidatus Bipolaricaulota bacterium]|nr:hypothetical protein [Candidatus Bipolaricaulota bacterium]MDW8141394.1 hypothetical protein [Candidatus Bipolaricaulota bacterium]